MAKNARIIAADPDTVFRVLSNGWLYASWVVGASRMRNVDDSWPEPGARLHHSVGLWPWLIDDSTSVVAWDAPRRAVLQARGWPVGEARVALEVRPHPKGSIVKIVEDANRGPGVAIPRPLRTLMLRIRNKETLNRLAYLAEGGAGQS